MFAPADDAFATIGLNPDDVGDLDQTVLTETLLCHVKHGRVHAEEVVMKDEMRTMHPDLLYVDSTVLKDQVDRMANIIVTDVEVSNGVIHVIDAAVLPYNPAAWAVCESNHFPAFSISLQAMIPFWACVR
jgi:uncharacterized surface protein with fasciclin (FAS1) repeats